MTVKELIEQLKTFNPNLEVKVDENNFIYRDNEKAYLVDCGTQLKSETNLRDYSNLILKVHSNLGIE